jgi:hypothetical protein
MHVCKQVWRCTSHRGPYVRSTVPLALQTSARGAAAQAAACTRANPAALKRVLTHIQR